MYNSLNDYIVVNFSGGKDSTAMLLHMIELGEHIDEVVCCDTGIEFPAMYDHIEKVKTLVQNAGIKFTVLKSDKPFSYYLLDHRVVGKGNNSSRNGYSWADSRNRWCTTLLKLNVINRYFRQLKKTCNVIQCVGLASDEVYRLERKNNQQSSQRHPLVEWNWTEQQCLEYCYSIGFNWNGLYEIFPRVSCWCCPLKSLDELRKLWKYFPELWHQLKEWDGQTWRSFRADYNIEQLEVRFLFEEERLSLGLSITNKDFYSELRSRLASVGI